MGKTTVVILVRNYNRELIIFTFASHPAVHQTIPPLWIYFGAHAISRNQPLTKLTMHRILQQLIVCRVRRDSGSDQQVRFFFQYGLHSIPEFSSVAVPPVGLPLATLRLHLLVLCRQVFGPSGRGSLLLLSNLTDFSRASSKFLTPFS